MTFSEADIQNNEHDLTNSAKRVNIVAGSSSGTEYTEGDVDATIIGTAVMFESDTGTNTLSVVNNTTPLPISDAGGSLTIDGSVTANAGTNLNTSLLALESGGNLDIIAGDTTAIQTSIELIDDAIYTDGTGTPSKAIGIAGTDGTNPQIVKTNTSGELQVEILAIPTTTVQATDLDIRNLTNVSDSIEVFQSTHDNLNANVNIQVGNSDVSDTNPVPVASQKASVSSTSGKVSVGSITTTILASNPARKSAMIVNDSDEDVYLNYSATAVINEGIRINANGGSIREESYTGVITGITASGGKNVTITEL